MAYSEVRIVSASCTIGDHPMGTPLDHQEPLPIKPRTSEPLDPGLVALLVILAIFMPVVGPVAALTVGICRRGTAGASTLIAIGVPTFATTLIIVSVMLPRLLPIPKFPEAEAKANAYTIQIALHRYYDDRSEYPTDLRQLIHMGYLFRLPPNPFTTELTTSVEFGSSDCAGNVTYLPLTKEGKVYGYYLLAYGSERTEGEDVNGDGVGDRVIAVLSSVSSEGPLPPLADLLK